MTATITVPVPVEGWLAINDRSVWQVRWRRTKLWRTLAHARTLQAGHAPIAGPFTVTATIHKATRVQYDVDGTSATVKACIDGARDAGLIEGDDTSRMTAFTILPGEVRKPACIVLTFTPAPTLPPYRYGQAVTR